MASAPAGRVIGSREAFKPYRSILKSISAPTRPGDSEYPVKKRKIGKQLPPWRRPDGTAFFLLNSEFARLYGEAIPLGEENMYALLVERMFRNFTSEKAGSDVEVEGIVVSPNGDRYVGWTVDELPMRARVEGDSGILYAEVVEEGTSRPGSARPCPPFDHQLTLLRQLCWNCRKHGHAYTRCPFPRNHLQIRASRDEFNAARDAMPDHAIPYLPTHSSTIAEKARRLDLADRFRPGWISEELAEAVWWVEDEDDDEAIEEIEAKKRRREWPWLCWMMRWGYPPGWIAGRGGFETRTACRLIPSVRSDRRSPSTDTTGSGHQGCIKQHGRR